MEKYAAEKGFQDPNVNCFAKKFVKQLCKFAHTATVEGKSPKAELYNFLLHYRATPHSTDHVSC